MGPAGSLLLPLVPLALLLLSPPAMFAAATPPLLVLLLMPAASQLSVMPASSRCESRDWARCGGRAGTGHTSASRVKSWLLLLLLCVADLPVSCCWLALLLLAAAKSWCMCCRLADKE